MQPSQYPLPHQQHPDEVQKTAVDEMGREQRELTAMNEVLAKKMGVVRSSHGRI